MAISEQASEPRRLAIGSYQTALCLLPHSHLCQDIDRLRALYDNAYGKWPPHINVVYPFVPIESLPEAVELVQSKLVNLGPKSELRNIQLRLEKSDHFSHRHGDTIFIAPSDGVGSQNLKHLRTTILEEFRQNDETYRPHLTIGQSQIQDTSSRDHLLAKASLLLPIEWRVQELFVLVREQTQGQENTSSQMKIWGIISFSGGTSIKAGRCPGFREKLQAEEEWSDKEERLVLSGRSTDMYPLVRGVQISTDNAGGGKISTTQPGNTYQFSTAASIWEPVRRVRVDLSLPAEEQMPSALTISSYNVLVDSVYPPVRDRYALLLRIILSECALADILVLQEVSDDFLSHLLGHGAIHSRYPYTTHGPPNQTGIAPLLSLRNIVVLSRWKFSWEWISFERRHKGAVILIFDSIRKRKESIFLPLIVAGVHLTCGLTDGAVAAKKSQLQALVSHLSRDYPENPWVIAGDFNLTTSAFTIDSALKKKSISPQTAITLFSVETMLSEARLYDSWFVARADAGEIWGLSQDQTDLEDLYEGEEGATFDPTGNILAAEAGGRGSDNRPQRYDRILVKGEDLLRVTGLNMFGILEENGSELGDGKIMDQNAKLRCGSDHWGVRAALNIEADSRVPEPEDMHLQLAPIQLRKATSNLSDTDALKSYLAELTMFPADEEVSKRKDVFALVKNILQQSPFQQVSDMAENRRSIISMVVVPVGSYGLGVWNMSSDIDCLCIGSISEKTFFALAGQRLRNAANLGVRILRKVKAASGTMLELDVRGIKFDLQYCPATRIAERYASLVHPFYEDVDRTDFHTMLIPIEQMARSNSATPFRSNV
jgi:endonuclease/exonuclease/phosphatase family metal-dependent hydrolase/2'-5' RNA ligase